MINGNKNLRAWERIDGNGNIIPCSISLRKNKPKDGLWREVTGNYCCVSDASGIITFSNTTASANITSISTADGVINWAGSLTNGHRISFIIPNGVDETFTIVTSTFSGRTITNANSYNSGDTGVISAVGALAAVTNTFTTSATPGAQYTSILS